MSGRQPRAFSATPAIVILLLAGLAFRLTIAYVLFPGSGFDSDLNTYGAWALQLAEVGPGRFYGAADFVDYPPAYLYVLWLVGILGQALSPVVGDPTQAVRLLLKLPSIVADLGVAVLLFVVVRSWAGQRADAARLGVIAAALYLFNPVAWYDSALWGQTDAVGALVILLGVALLIRGNSEGAALVAVLATLVKPQFGVVLLPIVAIVLLRRHLLRPGSNVRSRPLLRGPIGAWLAREQGPLRLVTSGLVGIAFFYAVVTPFSLDLLGFIRLVASAAGTYPYLTVNAYNGWALVGAGGLPPLAVNGAWSVDSCGQQAPEGCNADLIGSINGLPIGTLLLVAGFALGIARLAWRDDRRSIVLVAAYLSVAFFILPTRVHERYLFPVVALLPILAVADRRWLAITGVLSLASFMNLHGVLTTDPYGTENIQSLPLGEELRSFFGVATSALLHVGGFAFIAWRLRPRAALLTDRLARPWAGVRRGSMAAMRRSGTLAVGLLAQVRGVSLRRDRSAQLARERTGRLDRLDLLMVGVVLLSALSLRTWRLAEPYDMHFDEVYHARTATEFLQVWRYGIPHDIYEYTHPHMAKYLIAAGIVAWGNDRVTGETAVGAPVSAAAIEPRWSPEDAPGLRRGERLYVATDVDVRVYDLRDRTLVASMPFVARSLAVDETAHAVYLAAQDGSVARVATERLDSLRDDPSLDPQVTPDPFAPPGPSSDPLRLVVVDDTIAALFADGRLTTWDTGAGSELASRTIPGAVDVEPVPQSERVVAEPAFMAAPDEVAEELGDLLNREAADLERLFEDSTGDRVTIASYLSEEDRTAVQEAIDSGSLEGVTIESGRSLAVAAGRSLELVDALGLEALAEVELIGEAAGLSLDERLDQPTLYVATGNQVETVELDPDAAPTRRGSLTMPGTVRDTYWNPASNLIHALGAAPDGSGDTVYVIEPHGNAVFADARLPATAAAVVLDVQAQRPSEDRQELLAIDADGGLSAVDIGSHAFSWRMPGVIAGALTAVCLYLLARVLFRRRTVALIAAALVLVEGMFFANGRIAMNDTYVTFFIVAAVTLFTPVYLGRVRRPITVALALSLVGILLGLALSTKWVGAYAIGGVLLLVLLRSALGRLIALAGMIGLTGLLGFLAITPAADIPADSPSPQLNFLFLGLMVALTLLLGAAIVLRPVRFSRHELGFAVGAPLLVGLGLVGAAILLAGSLPPDGLLSRNRLLLGGGGLLALGLGAMIVAWIAGRFGRGPLAAAREANPRTTLVTAALAPSPTGSRVAQAPPLPSQPRPAPARATRVRSAPAQPAPAGWLRPGWGLGVPWLFALLCLGAIPLLVYVASYAPWVGLGNRWTDDLPPGNTGQTLFALTKSMYDYHNDLRATHAASSPWWAWPFDLKPVWFFQEEFANRTTGVIYDAGNLVIFWLAIPAVAWTAGQAWRRRSLSLTVVVLGIAALWLPWTRIDRATFQYHVFASLPFTVIALSYFLAELWHGPGRRTWMLARAAGAMAVLGPALLWLARAPLCTVAGTERVHPGGQACNAVTTQFQVSQQMAGAVAVAAVGLLLLGWQLLRTRDEPRESMRQTLAGRGAGLPRAAGPLLVLVGMAIGVVATQVLLSPDPLITTAPGLGGPYFLAIFALGLLAVPAWLVLRARDPRRFTLGVLGAAVVWFVLWYPNISGLPLPSSLAQVYLGLLPTYNYDFQFAVNTSEPYKGGILQPGAFLLVALVAIAALAAMYAAWTVRSGGGPPRASGRTPQPSTGPPISEPG